MIALDPVPAIADGDGEGGRDSGLLFDEPLDSETGLWCVLADGIDPTRMNPLETRRIMDDA